MSDFSTARSKIGVLKGIWGRCLPVLVPHFNEMGELMKLRTYNGGAPAGTVAGWELVYVPRDFRKCTDLLEKFRTVIVCEWEFKAVAITTCNVVCPVCG